MTKVIEKITGGTGYQAYVAAFILNEAGVNAASSGTFVPSWSTTPENVSYGSVLLANANQTTLIGASASNASTSGATITTSALATGDGDIVIDAVICGNVGDYAMNNGFTKPLEHDMSSSTGADGYKFATGAAETPSATYTGTMNRQAIIGFVVKAAPAGPITRTLSVSSSAGGTVTAPGLGDFNYSDGNVVTLTASANANYHFVNWTGSAVTAGKVADPNSSNTTVTMNGNYNVQANFAINQYTITASAGPNGSVAPTSVVVNYGGNQDFNATPAAGYDVNMWSVDGNTVQTGGTTYTLTNITASHTVTVTFSQIILSISGYVVEPDGNSPVEDVLIGTDDNDINAVTDANGFYKLFVNSGWSGIVTPLKDGFVFEPNSNTYANVTHDYNDINYTATLTTFRIAGLVLGTDHITAISDVNVSAENDGGSWTSRYGGGHSVTDVNGYYEVRVDYNWSGKVTPTRYAYVFEPNSRNYQFVKEDQTVDQNYTGTLLAYRIIGCIKNECNVPIEGVLVDADNGGGEDTTNADGLYEVWVGYAWSGTVMPTKQHYTFEPNQMSYVNVPADQFAQNYIAGNVYDLDCDGSIGLGDVGVIADNWLLTSPEKGDFDGNGTVNFFDFAEFGTVWQNK